MDTKLAMVEHKLSEEIHTDVTYVQKQFKKLYYKDDDGKQVLDEAKLPEAIGSLAYMRSLERQIDGDFKARTQTLSNQLKPYESEKKSLKKLIEEMDGQLINSFEDLRKDGKLTDSMEGKGGAKLILARKRMVEIDPERLPKRLFKSVPDMEAIQKELDDGKAINGVLITTKIVYSTRLPEDIEVKS